MVTIDAKGYATVSTKTVGLSSTIYYIGTTAGGSTAKKAVKYIVCGGETVGQNTDKSIYEVSMWMAQKMVIANPGLGFLD